MPGNRSLYVGPFSFDSDTNTAAIDLPGGGGVAVSPRGAEVSLPGGGRVSLGPGGGVVDVPGAGRLEVRGNGMVLLPGGQVWNTRDLFSYPDAGSTPAPGGLAPIPYPNVGTSQIEIRIPVPHFVVERFEVPITLPRFSAHPLDVPVPMPRVQPMPFDLPWPYPWPSGPKMPTLPSIPLPEQPELLPSQGPPARYVTQIKTAIASVVDQAMQSAEVVVGVINGSVGLIPPGALRCPINFKVALRSAIVAAGVPLAPYSSITDILADAWTDWIAGYSTVVQYPSFAQWPGAAAPPMSALGQTLNMGSSSGMSTMSAIALHAAMTNAVDPTTADTEFEEGMRQLTQWHSLRFVLFGMTTMLTNVIGGGPVPSYAPPSVLAGPVIGGTIIRSVGVLVGSNPFRVP